MLSENIFEQVEQVCRFVKDVNTIFGGLQVILCGDFLQLKPVANQKYNDPGNYILHSDKFRFHKFVLTEVHRQSEDTLIKAVHELSKGTDVSQQTVDFLNRMKRKLPPGNVPVKLFARNYDVDKYNSEHLMDMEGEIKTFRAADVGDTKQLKSCLADHLIYLKDQAKVMLVVNLSAKLVNGLCWTIIKMNNDSVEVKFNFINQVVKIERYKFAVYSPEKRQDIACRSQIPLKLAFAITTHKAQGLTLKRVEIDCRHMTNPGQIGVAIGRASEVKGLRVLNFSKKLVTKHNESIYDFYSSESISFHDDFSCCKAIITEPEARPSLEGAKTAKEENTLSSQLPEEDLYSDEGEDLTQELEDITILDQLFGAWENERVQEVLLEHPLPMDFNLQIVLKEMMYKETLTDEQLTLNKCITEIKTCTEKVKLFGDTIHNKLFAFYKDSMPSENDQIIENRHVTAFYRKVILYTR